MSKSITVTEAVSKLCSAIPENVEVTFELENKTLVVWKNLHLYCEDKMVNIALEAIRTLQKFSPEFV